MLHDYPELAKILKPFIDAEEGETGDYPELDEVLRKVVEWQGRSITELDYIKKVRFKEEKFYSSHLTKEERWGCIWCCNFINEMLGVGDGANKETKQ